MDDPAILLLLLSSREEATRAQRLSVFIVHGAFQSRERKRERRMAHRLYLTRPDLLPKPRSSSSWTHLYEAKNDRAFIQTMGFNVETFQIILDGGFADAWEYTPIPRQDTNSYGEPRAGRRSLDAAGALGLCLHYLNSTMTTKSLQEIFALIPSTTSRYLDFALDILLRILEGIPEAKVRFPQELESFQHLSNLIEGRHPLLSGAFGFLDGWKTPVYSSADVEIENMNYNGWLHHHFISSITMFDPTGVVIACRLNAPGSWHDARIARPIYDYLLYSTPPGFYIIADTAFPRGPVSIAGRIKAPLKQGQRLPADPNELNQAMAFNRELVSARQAAEWGMRALQGTFARIKMPMDANDAAGRQRILKIVIRLHNLRTRLVGINQIRNVYEPVWKETGDDCRLWDHFEDIVFGEMRRHDRVSRFHVVPANL